MGKRITTQMLADQLRQNGWEANQLDAFVDAFFQTLVDGITSDGIVKVKGLGTFKTVKVADRASVDVNTGERIVIPGHNKLKFVEEDKVNTFLNSIEQESESQKQETAQTENPVSTEQAQLTQEEGRGEQQEGHSKWWIWALVALFVVLIAVCLISIFANKPAAESPTQIEQKTSTVPSKPAQITNYKVHLFQKGESLTTISVLYYNTPDSVARIMQLNGLSDTSFIPLGTELKLP